MLTLLFTLLLCVAFTQTEAANDVGEVFQNDINEIADRCAKSACDKYTVIEKANVSNYHCIYIYLTEVS